MPEPKKIYRYPAVNPFSEEQSMLFFGRSEETQRLASLIFSEKLTVLYGKSGYGKSSLLNAGILPRLREENAGGKRRYLPIPVQFKNAEKDGQTLFDKFRFHWKTAIKKSAVPPAPLNLSGLPDTLWGLFKTVDFQAVAATATDRVTSSHPVSIVLLFDQFEEFFSYPVEQQAQFREQLSELLYTTYPTFLRENRHFLPPDAADWLGRDLDVRAVFAIREDRLSDLDRLSDRLPDILRKRMQLIALDEEQARAAIVRPAAFGDKPEEQALLDEAGLGFHSPTFAYDPAAVSKIIRELSGAEAQSIESFQLQIVCFSIEKKVEKERLNHIGVADLPDFETLYDNYYGSQIEEIGDPDLRQTARRLLEFGLLFVDTNTGDAHRRSVDSLELAQSYGATPDLLDALEKTYLIRREVNSFNRFSYEISHDTLMKPVLKSRRAAEEVEARQKIAAEKADAERRRRRALVTSLVAGVLILVAVGASVFALQKTNEAREQQEKANAAIIELERQKQRVEAATLEIEMQKSAAKTAESRANAALKIATEMERTAQAAEKLAIENKEIADSEKKKAVTESELSSLSKQKAENLLEASKIIAQKKLPKNFDALIPLSSLNCQEWGLYSLSAEIGKLKNLKSLDLSGNFLNALPPDIAQCKSLEWLDISSNKFETLPVEILKQMTNLKTLIIHGFPHTHSSNPLKNEDIENLKKIIPWCKIEWWSEQERKKMENHKN